MPYTFDNSVDPPSVLPAGLDPSTLIDITKPGDKFRVYFEPTTGHVHTGSWYADLMRMELEQGGQS